jgi:hypothetical protein
LTHVSGIGMPDTNQFCALRRGEAVGHDLPDKKRPFPSNRLALYCNNHHLTKNKRPFPAGEAIGDEAIRFAHRFGRLPRPYNHLTHVSGIGIPDTGLTRMFREIQFPKQTYLHNFWRSAPAARRPSRYRSQAGQ